MPLKLFHHDVDAAIGKMVAMVNARENVVFGVELEGGYHGEERFYGGFLEILPAIVRDLTQTATGFTCLLYCFRQSLLMPEALVKRSTELLRRFGPPEAVPPGLEWLINDVTQPPTYLLPLRVDDWDIAAIDLVTIGSASPYVSGPFFLRPGVRL
jgi:hypothetical protein